MRVNDLVKRERPCDDRLQFTGRELIEYPTLRSFQPFRVQHNRKQCVTPNYEIVSKNNKQWERCRFSRKRAINKDHTFRTHRLRNLLELGADHRIKGQIDALP